MNDKILDLAALVCRFSDSAAREASLFKEPDELVIAAMKDKSNLSIEKRVCRLVEFWHNMSVARTLRGAPGVSIQVAKEIIEKFADTLGPDRTLADPQLVLEKFKTLCGICIGACNTDRKFQKKDGTVRDLTSLTSKTLWCCYPSAVPMYDVYAHRALHVLSRLLDMEPRRNVEEGGQHPSQYEPFIEVWFDLYKQIKSEIEAAAKRFHYDYPVRVFDKMLWIIGNDERYGKWA